MSQFVLALFIASSLSGLVACGAVPAPQPAATASPAVSSSGTQQSYDLFSWLDPSLGSGQCSFALLNRDTAPRTDDYTTALANRVRSEGKVGLDGLESAIKALPRGATVHWSDALAFMSSLQFGLPQPARVEQVRQIARESGLTLNLAPSYQGAGNGLPCQD